MKKISYLSIISFIIAITVVMYFDTSIHILKQNVGINAWLCVVISSIIGIIPLLLVIYISKYQEDLNIFEKIKNLYGNIIGSIINIFIMLILFIITISLLYNICDFIISQFLYRTPILISMILIISLAIYNNIKGINVITKVSFILITLSIILFLTCFFSQITDINIDNFLPFLKEDTKNIIPSILKITSINTLPLIIILVIPKNQITKSNKYTKIIIIGYIIGCLISLLSIIQTYGVLGKYLVKTYEYPEYMLLKRVKLFGLLERIENIISIEWILGSYVYITLLIYSMSKCLYQSKKHISKYIYIAIGLILIITTKLFFQNNTILTNFTKNIFPYITSLLIVIYLIVSIKIFLNKKKYVII